jgi:hypothetical protein
MDGTVKQANVLSYRLLTLRKSTSMLGPRRTMRHRRNRWEDEVVENRGLCNARVQGTRNVTDRFISTLQKRSGRTTCPGVVRAAQISEHQS